MGKKQRKTRAQLRKNRSTRARRSDWTQRFQEHGFEDEALLQQERITGKGELTRRRTVIGTEAEDGDEPGLGVRLEVDETVCRPGRVLSVHGRVSTVRGEDGQD